MTMYAANTLPNTESEKQNEEITPVKCSEHYEDYTYQNYREEMTKYVLSRKSKLQTGKLIYPTTIAPVRRNILEFKVKEAIEKQMIFTILGYYPAVRHKLVSLGWVEKIDSKDRTQTEFRMKNDFNVTYLDSAPCIIRNERSDDITTQYFERQYMSDILEERQPDVLFSLRKNYINWKTLADETIVSYFPKCNCCSKIGLNLCLEQAPLFECRNETLKFPRGYNMTNELAMKRFVQDYRETSCFCLMRFIKDAIEKQTTLFSIDGTVEFDLIDHAERVCKKCIMARQLEYIEETNLLQQDTLEETEEEYQQWNKICEEIYNVTSHGSKFVFATEEEIKNIYKKATSLVEKYEGLNPQEIFDGMYNMWVLKPVANCSGHGIRVYRQLEEIKKAIGTLKNLTYARFVVQKYIEKPLLIHGVKSDLRLWYLVTHMGRMKLFVYQEGYVRFCSKPHSSQFLDEMRHLTNVRIQKQYRNIRDPPQLPPELMWDFKQMNDYFKKELNQPKRWSNIMKAMCDTLIMIMKCAQSSSFITLRKNAFQLFGADFLISESLEPCLIEINNGPGLSPTTSIIARTTTQLLTDIVKVIHAEKFPTQTSHDLGLFKKIFEKEIVDYGKTHMVDKATLDNGVINYKALDINEWKMIKKTIK